MKNNHYVTNEELIPELEEFTKTGKMSEKLGSMVLMIARGLANKGNFCNYTWKDDMIGEAVLAFLKFGKSYNPEVSKNAFGYIDMACYRAFIAYIKKQKKHSKIKNTCFEFMEQETDVLHNTDSIDYTLIKD